MNPALYVLAFKNIPKTSIIVIENFLMYINIKYCVHI